MQIVLKKLYIIDQSFHCRSLKQFLYQIALLCDGNSAAKFGLCCKKTFYGNLLLHISYGSFRLADPDSDPYSDSDSCTIQILREWDLDPDLSQCEKFWIILRSHRFWSLNLSPSPSPDPAMWISHYTHWFIQASERKITGPDSSHIQYRVTSKRVWLQLWLRPHNKTIQLREQLRSDGFCADKTICADVYIFCTMSSENTVSVTCTYTCRVRSCNFLDNHIRSVDRMQITEFV